MGRCSLISRYGRVRVGAFTRVEENYGSYDTTRYIQESIAWEFYRGYICMAGRFYGRILDERMIL